MVLSKNLKTPKVVVKTSLFLTYFFHYLKNFIEFEGYLDRRNVIKIIIVYSDKFLKKL